MDFLRRNNEEYVVQFSKAGAIKELKKDFRVDKITRILTGINVHTKPIIPYITASGMLCKYPIGNYIIKITTRGRKLNISIKRKEGMICAYFSQPTIHHYHVRGSFNRGICWGNVEYGIYEICKKGDWYWAVKRCLDLLMDSKSDSGNRYDHSYIMKDLIKTYKEAHNL